MSLRENTQVERKREREIIFILFFDKATAVHQAKEVHYGRYKTN